MKYIVTGGAGFIGSHLVERLLEEVDSNVLVIDNFYEGKMENLPVDPRLTVIQGDVLNKGLGKYFRGVDVVLHLAALTRPQWSIEYPDKSNKVNVEGTIKVFMNAKEHRVKRVVFVSSSSAYGEQETYPTNEDAPFNPMSPYALQKAIGEQYAKLFEKLYGLEVNYIRPFNVYGTRQSPSSPYSAAVPKFIDRVRRGEQPMITGDGEQVRDFVYIDDVVEIIRMASKCKEYGEAFNAGSGKNISINYLAEEICKLMGMVFSPIYIPAVFEPRKTLADMSKVKRIFNWEPQVSLIEGLARTISGTIHPNTSKK